MSVSRRDAEYRSQPSLFDSVADSMPSVVAPKPEVQPKPKSEQQRNLDRVKVSIADVIIEFFEMRRIGDRFFAADLHRFVGSRAQIAPASADRVMRDLRHANVINYCVVSRSRSEYRVEDVVRESF
jgi:hypothetical protein